MAVKALCCHGCKGFILTRLSGLRTVMAVRTLYCHGCQGFMLSWLLRALHGHGSPSLILSRLSGLHTVMTNKALYCHGYQGHILSRPSRLHTVTADIRLKFVISNLVLGALSFSIYKRGRHLICLSPFPNFQLSL